MGARSRKRPGWRNLIEYADKEIIIIWDRVVRTVPKKPSSQGGDRGGTARPALHPGQKSVLEMYEGGKHVADKVAGLHSVGGPAYTYVKGVSLAVSGETTQAAAELATILPGVGDIAGAIKEHLGTIDECKPPLGK